MRLKSLFIQERHRFRRFQGPSDLMARSDVGKVLLPIPYL
jgi:hypothetical protein